MEMTNKVLHHLRIEAKSGNKSKLVEFPIDEATEKWLLNLERTDDETSDFTVRGGTALKIRLSIINKGLDF